MSDRGEERRFRFRFPLRTRARITREIDDELEFHLAMRREEFLAEGLSPDEAQARALSRFGDIAGAKSYMRYVGGRQAVLSRAFDATRGWGQDVAHAARAIVRTPSFFVTATLVLALAIGATTAVYSVAYHLVLAPVPSPIADRLVALWMFDRTERMRISADVPIVEAARRRVPGLERVETFRQDEVTLHIDDVVESLSARFVSPGLLSLFAVRPSLGRGFRSDEGKVGGERVVMLAWSFWQQRFGGAPDVLGRALLVDNEMATVVGVMPPGMNLDFFDNAPGTALWFPEIPPPDGGSINALGVLRPGVSATAIDRSLAAVQRGMDSTNDRYTDFVTRALPIPLLVDEELSRTVVLVGACAAVVLLIACANISSLLMARATARQRELAVRMALGAGRWRIVRYLLLESLLLAITAGALGIGVAAGALRMLAAFHPGDLPMLETVQLHPTALLVALGAALGSGLLFGVAPALSGTSANVHDALHASGRGASASRGARRLRSVLVGGQFAASAILLVTALLLLRSIVRLQAVPLGYDPDGLVAMSVSLPEARYPNDTARASAVLAITERVRSVPGVRSVTVGSGTPSQHGVLRAPLFLEGRPAPSESDERFFAFTSVGPGYFEVTGMPVRRGRAPAAGSALREVAVDETTARLLWPNEDPIGRRFRTRDDSPWRTVVGLVGNVRAPGEVFGRGEHFYYPLEQSDRWWRIIARVDGPPAAALSRVAASVLTFDPFVLLRNQRTEVAELARMLARPRFLAALFSAFAVVALVLAAVGLYGVLAYSVGQRRREIGVRMALGADASRVARLVVSDAIRVVLVGLVIGVAGALAAGRVVGALLFEVAPNDMPTLVGATALLAIIALLAAWIPAQRAARVNPMEAVAAE